MGDPPFMSFAISVTGRNQKEKKQRYSCVLNVKVVFLMTRASHVLIASKKLTKIINVLMNVIFVSQRYSREIVDENR